MQVKNSAFKLKKIAVLVSSISIASMSNLASAEDELSSLALEEVVVTATKRATKLQDTALAISALTGESLEVQPLADAMDIGARVPSVVLTQRVGQLQTTIRGVGITDLSLGADPRVAFYTDGVYVARGAAQMGLVYDVERVEVVSGPQGTLFGRNATAGAISIITRAPTEELSGYVRQTMGNYSLLMSEAAVSSAITDNLSFRVASQVVDRDGFGKNINLDSDLDDQHSKAFRGRLRWAVDNFQADLIGDFYKREDAAFAVHSTGEFVPNPPIVTAPPPWATDPEITQSVGLYDSAADWPMKFSNETNGLALNVDWTISDQLTAKSFSSYRENEYQFLGDTDNTNYIGIAGASAEESESISQEFQLIMDFGRVGLTTGVFWFEEEIYGRNHLNLGSGLLESLFSPLYTAPEGPDVYQAFGFNDAKLDTTAYAAFAEAQVDVTDKLTLTLGGRYSYEEKEVRRGAVGFAINPFAPLPEYDGISQDYRVPDSAYQPARSKDWDSFDIGVTAQYQFSPDFMGYITYKEGFKSGAFGLADFNDAVDPEVMEDIEAGIKTAWLDGRMQANLYAFWYDYTDLQVNAVNPVTTALEVANAAEASISGAQLEVTAQVTDKLRLSLDSIYVSSEFDEYTSIDAARPQLGPIDLSGNDLPQSPEYRISLTGEYVVPVGANELTFNLKVTATDDYYLDAFNEDHMVQDANSIVDGSIYYRLGNGLNFSIWGNNLTDEEVISFAVPPSVPLSNQIARSYNAPRTYGVRIGYEW